jgi:hypothetical protein
MAGGFKSALGGPLGRLSGPTADAPTPVSQSWDSSWQIRNLVTQEWTSEWVVRGLTSQTWDSAWAVRNLVPQEWSSSWKTAMTNLVRLDRYSVWRVLGIPGALTRAWDSSWRVTTTTAQAWDSSWLVKDTDPLAQAWDSSWKVGGLVRASLDSRWKVSRASYIDPGTGLEVVTDLDPYFALNGITDIIASGPMEPGGEAPAYDEIRHCDGSLLIHDVHEGLYEQQWSIRLEQTSMTALDALEEAIRAACRTGGTVSYQSIDANGTPGAMRTWTFAPSPAPSFRIDQEREALFRSSATLQLHIWPDL